MQLIRNDGLIRRRVRLASGAHLLALVIFGAGVFFSQDSTNLWYVYGTMVVGLGLYSFGQHYLKRWGPRYRYDRALVQTLKGLDQRYALAAFVDPALPDYMVTGPQGVVPLVLRAHSGTIVCRNDTWVRVRGKFGFIGQFFTPAIKNPTADAKRAAEQTRAYLVRHGVANAESIPIAPSIVFIHPQAHLRVDGCSVPVTTAKELRAHLRRGKPALTKLELEAIQTALEANIST